jgi:hypothetical protein
MSDLKEYIVTAADYKILDDLCNDIETPGGALYIPDRAVEIANPRPSSRNTHYYLTDQEAELIRQDPRVLAVEQLPDALGLEPSPLWTQTETTWNKSSTNTNSHKNWGLLRVAEGATRSNWGSNGTTSQSGTVIANAAGKNVDVVIVDGLFDPAHPEFAVNTDGTGGSRVNQYNWYQHTPEVTGSSVSTYVYTPYTGTSAETNNNHGAHVAGTVAGNTQGWARDAKIYNIYPYGINPSALYIFDYIRAFHRAKPIDPNTGLRTPTITNNSWGYRSVFPYTEITSLTFRGTTYSGPFTISQLQSYGIITNGSNEAILSARYPALDVDVADAIAEGIIVVGAAGNNYQKNDLVGGSDYNNNVVRSGGTYYYNRGSSPTAASNTICVGAASALVNDSKATFSNCGPRVDIYAPGENIMSSFNSTASYGGTPDTRNSNYFIGKIGGTSMASPQVCGVLACILEIYPNMKQSEAVSYITSYAKTGQITATSGGVTDYTDLQGSANRYLFYVKERALTGEVYPKNNYKSRPATGAVFPRTRILRYGS